MRAYDDGKKSIHTLDMFRLTGQVAVVTGGAGQYGKLISLGLCEAGATVIIAANDLAACQKAADNLVAQGHDAVAVYLDLSDEESIRHATEEVIRRFGRLDILVNNAVSRIGNQNLEDAVKEDWEASERVNAVGAMLLTQHAVRQMRKQNKGNIINISSVQGVVGPYFPMYEMDDEMVSGLEYTYNKWGMIGFTKWLANYYGRYNIRANCISPGGYNAVGTNEEIRSPHIKRTYEDLTPMGRFADDNDIKGPVVFLASEASRYVTGHNLVVDGGYTCW